MASTATPNKTGVVAIARGTSNAAGGVTRSVAIPVGFGGRVTGRISNGNPAPTTAATIRVYAATPEGAGQAAPAVGANNAAIGADWFLIATLYGATVVNSDVRDVLPLYVGPEYQYIVTEVAENVGANVTAEVRFSYLPSIAST